MFPIHNYMIYVPLVAQNIYRSLRIQVFLFCMKGLSHNCTANVLISSSFFLRPIRGFNLRVIKSNQTYILRKVCLLSPHKGTISSADVAVKIDRNILKNVRGCEINPSHFLRGSTILCLRKIRYFLESGYFIDKILLDSLGHIY